MPPESFTMTERGTKLLSVLRTFNCWATRSLIAARLGSDQLDGRDFVALNLLIERGLIEVQYAENSYGRTLEYRFIKFDEQATQSPDDVAE